MEHISDLLVKFLRQRGLTSPDGRPLYEYRCTDDEFESFAEALSDEIPNRPRYGRLSMAQEKVFCLWAAEWWRRNHEGGVWAWDGPVSAIGCPDLQPGGPNYPLLCQSVASGIEHWKRELLRSATGRAFLVTLACEGGLPLKLVLKDQANLRRYFRAVLGEFQASVGTGMQPKKLAERVRSRLPKSLQHDVVYELTGRLIAKIWEFQAEVGETRTPVKALDRIHPSWRDELPLRVDDDIARLLLNNLVSEASSIARHGARRIRWSRGLRPDGSAWQLTAELELPAVFAPSEFAALFGLKDDFQAPPRFEMVRLPYGGSLEVAALGTTRFDAEGGEYIALEPTLRGHRQAIGADAVAGCSLQARDGRNTWESREFGGSESLSDDLPWVFEFRGEDLDTVRFAGEGSRTLRASKAIIVVPIEQEVSALAEADQYPIVQELGPLQGVNRVVYQIEGAVVVVDQAGDRSVIRTGVEGASGSLEYRLRGARRSFGVGSSETFDGPPEVVEERLSGLTQPISLSHVQWRPAGTRGEWRAYDDACRGDVQIRYADSGEVRFVSTAKVAPKGSLVKIEPGKGGGQGTIQLAGFAASEVHVVSDDRVAGRVSIGSNSGDYVIEIECRGNSPRCASLVVSWKRDRQLQLDVPFPVLGGCFRKPNGEQLAAGDRISVRNLAGTHGLALVPTAGCVFYVDGQYRGEGVPHNVAHNLSLRVRLAEIAPGHFEYDLGNLQSQIELILSMTEDIDGAVELQLDSNEVPDFPPHRLRIARFDLEFEGSREFGEVMLSTESFQTVDSETIQALRVEAFPLCEPQRDPIKLDRIRNGVWRVPQKEMEDGPWLILGWDGGWCRPRPCLWIASRSSEPQQIEEVTEEFNLFPEDGGLDEIELGDEPKQLNIRWASAFRSRKQRIGAFKRVLEDLVENGAHADWERLEATIRWTRDVPATTFDLVNALIESPAAAAYAAIRSHEEDFPNLWDRLETLPFSWRSIPISAWDRAVEQYVAFLRAGFLELGDAAEALEPERLIREQVEQAVGRIVSRLDCLRPVFGLTCQRLLDQPLEAQEQALFAGHLIPIMVQQRDECQADLLRELADDDRWPGSDWVVEQSETLKRSPVYGPMWIQARSGVGWRQDVLDAPVLAAILAVDDSVPSKSLMQDLRRFAHFSPQWYEQAFHWSFLYALSLKFGEGKKG